MHETPRLSADDVVGLVKEWAYSAAEELPGTTSGMHDDLARWRESLPETRNPTVGPAKLCPNAPDPE
jgi:hypothetical protein